MGNKVKGFMEKCPKKDNINKIKSGEISMRTDEVTFAEIGRAHV